MPAHKFNWPPRQPLAQVRFDVSAFLDRCRDRHLLAPLAAPHPHRIMGAAILEGRLNSDAYLLGKPVSKVMTMGYDRGPDWERVREDTAVCLASAVRLHYLLDQDAVVTGEPMLAGYPDTFHKVLRPLLMYPIETPHSRGPVLRTLLVAPWEWIWPLTSKVDGHLALSLEQDSRQWLRLDRLDWLKSRRKAWQPLSVAAGKAELRTGADYRALLEAVDGLFAETGVPGGKPAEGATARSGTFGEMTFMAVANAYPHRILLHALGGFYAKDSHSHAWVVPGWLDPRNVLPIVLGRALTLTPVG